ncbi:MAG: carbohydrate ABC transporter permease [Spirochaetes bacterium]|nr:carbohydrate ABC transporter permease [Spirochaetota bacterium]
MTRLLRRWPEALIILFLTVAALTCLLPLVHELAMAISSNDAVLSRKVGFIPIEPTFNSFREVFKDASVLQSLVFSIYLTVAFMVIAMALTIAAAYPLTRPELKGRKFLTTVIVITMYFSGGILPLYVLIKMLGLLNTMWSLILPLAVSPYNLIILRTSLMSVPDSITESALIDGASYFRILLQIILPLSMPILATLSLFYAVGRWNMFQDALFYISNARLYTLQLKLAYIVINNTSPEVFQLEGAAAGHRIVPAAITAATVIVATVPILVAYPWLQRYFISGVMLGSVKG